LSLLNLCDGALTELETFAWPLESKDIVRLTVLPEVDAASDGSSSLSLEIRHSRRDVVIATRVARTGMRQLN
jgi:hypothetical protein